MFSSQIIHVINYVNYFSRTNNQFILSPLIPLTKKAEYENKFIELTKSRYGNVIVSPIFTRISDSRFRYLLNPVKLVRDFLSILKTLKHWKPEAVLCFYLIHAYPLVIFKKILGYSLFVVAMGGDINLQGQGPSSKKMEFFNKLLTRFICSRSENVFAVSYQLHDRIKEISGRESLVMPTGVDPSFFKLIEKEDLREKHGLTKNSFIVLTVCDLIVRKGVNILIKSIKILKSRVVAPIKLVIAGDGPERASLEELVSELELEKDVIFLGFKHRSELLELYNIANLFVLASYSEGLPFALLEAMACECISIATNVGDVPRVLSDGKNGFLVSPGDPLSLADKIKHVLSLPEEELHLLCDQARRTVLENFDFRKLTKKMISIISQRVVNDI